MPTKSKSDFGKGVLYYLVRQMGKAAADTYAPFQLGTALSGCQEMKSQLGMEPPECQGTKSQLGIRTQ